MSMPDHAERYFNLMRRYEEVQTQLNEIEAVLDSIPECDTYTENNTTTCGWKHAIHQIQETLNERPAE